MREISGHYTSKINDIVDFKVSIPGEWEELEPKQFAAILQVLTYRKADEYTIAASLLSLLFGPKNWHVLNNLPDEDLHALTSLTEFLFTTRPPAINKFPRLKVRKKYCAAPADDLSNIGFGEWCFAYEFYSAYLKYQDSIFLDKLIVTLYRPSDLTQVIGNVNFSGDVRERINENQIDDRVRGLRDVEPKYKQAAFAWAAAAFMQVMEARPNVFPVAKEGEENAAPSDGDGRTWLTVFRELLGPKWGTVDQLKYTNAMFVLDALEEQRIEFDSAAAPAE
jgi:hypothetical protein